jgi:cell division protein FtsQ
MSKLKPFLRVAGLVLAGAAVVLTLGFVEHATDGTPVSELVIDVVGGEGMHFIDEQAVRQEVIANGTPVMGAPLGALDARNIEERLRNIPCVADAEVYHTLEGTLHVDVEQRQPVVRVLNSDGSSFYIDEEGWTMPTSTNYTARVLVVTGWLTEPGAVNGVRSVYESDSLQQHFRSDEIHRLALFIRRDPLWNALIDQVVVNADGEFELVPRVGSQRILLGDGSALEQRFEKLRLFYRDGMPKADWRRYAKIDLRFADQIVCTKRNSPQ